jgi:aromatic-L-amino-acid decarboxylase
MTAAKSPSVSPNLGDMSKEEFLRFGHELVDWIAQYFDRIEDLPVLSRNRTRRSNSHNCPRHHRNTASQLERSSAIWMIGSLFQR